ncbi:uncharacterized protein [Gossypium hirsutum]|uniref:Integrase zinc-binding domain-containing protein n=1 Tax=Gossypium hirsutum TaxID=3635 RepID=A0ABM3BWG4_GOSHI|nr:uncharacterized protein LOC121230547 [Gossypium hirsutum]
MVTLFHNMMYKEIEVYVNDMIAKSRTEKEHIQVLRKLFLRLRKFQLKLNPTKCTFEARSEKLLGFIVSEKRIEVDPDKVKAIQQLPLPRTQKEVRGFLGRLNYIARFISQLTEKCDPIFHLLKKHNLGLWDDECQETFNRVKQYLSNPPVLTPPSPGRPLILYLTKAVKGSAIADFLASRALEDYEPLNFDFPNEDLMYVATTKEDIPEDLIWKLNFDGASNAVGNGIGTVLISLSGDYYPFTCKLDFDCTNNMTEYEACIMGIPAAIERDIQVSEVFDDVIFRYLQRDENQMTDALVTLAFMVRVNKREDMKLIQMSICEAPAHCYNIDKEEEGDNYPWLASDYVLDGEILYKRRKYHVLLRCVDAVEAKEILEEVHEGVCGTHANGFTMARQIIRFEYYWFTMEGDCISYAKKCHKYQIYRDKIHVLPSPLHVITSPWPFSMWGMDVIRPISPGLLMDID